MLLDALVAQEPWQLIGTRISAHMHALAYFSAGEATKIRICALMDDGGQRCALRP